MGVRGSGPSAALSSRPLWQDCLSTGSVRGPDPGLDRGAGGPARCEHANFASSFSANSEDSLTTERGRFVETTEERS